MFKAGGSYAQEQRGKTAVVQAMEVTLLGQGVNLHRAGLEQETGYEFRDSCLYHIQSIRLTRKKKNEGIVTGRES